MCLEALKSLLSDKHLKTLVITGAGISLRSGIPLYRSENSLIDDSILVEFEELFQSDDSSDELNYLGDNSAVDENNINTVKIINNDLLNNDNVTSDQQSSTTESVCNVRTEINEFVKRDLVSSDNPLTADSLSSFTDVGVSKLQRNESPKADDIVTDFSTMASSMDCSPGDKSSDSNLDDSTGCCSNTEECGHDASSELKPIWSAELQVLATKKVFSSFPISWYRNFWLRTHQTDQMINSRPNINHLLLTYICNTYNCSIVTQNIDSLHRRAALSTDKLIEIHGLLGLYRCLNPACIHYQKSILTPSDGLEFIDYEQALAVYESSNGVRDFEVHSDLSDDNTDVVDDDSSSSTCSKPPSVDLYSYLHEKLSSLPSVEMSQVPLCKSCKSVSMPLTLLFDESYTCHSFFRFVEATSWVHEADVIVFIGTSFQVYFTQLVIALASEYKKTIVNINPSTYKSDDFSEFEDLLQVMSSHGLRSEMANMFLRCCDRRPYILNVNLKAEDALPSLVPEETYVKLLNLEKRLKTVPLNSHNVWTVDHRSLLTLKEVL